MTAVLKTDIQIDVMNLVVSHLGDTPTGQQSTGDKNNDF